MSMLGLMGLLVAFAAVVVSVVCLALGAFLARKQTQANSLASTLSWAGHVGSLVVFISLTMCCGVLLYCFMTGDNSIEYVVREHSTSSSSFAWLYKFSGLWAGREGSLLFWAWLISAFDTVVCVRNLKRLDKLDSMALLIGQLVLAAFVGVLLFSANNMPFKAMAASYFNADGTLKGEAAMWGMNTLLEHWAMAIHPPTLFVGYAGLTIPFSYAIAALIVNDPSKTWVVRSQRYTLFSWFFLGVGIGLGAIWAYVVLGWGGYWGWDAVENASLLSWLVGVALIHSFTVYRQKEAFKRWSVMCACLAFAFVVVGTFIARSGLVQSVHAFEGDSVSLILFGSLICLSILAGIVGLMLRWKSFGPDKTGVDEWDSMASKNAAYYFNNVIMVVFTLLLTYMTVSSAIPSWLPFGGQTLSAGTFNGIARPLGVVYLAILAVCPLLSWGKTTGRLFWKRARIPGLCALVLFVALAVYFFTYLLPSYNNMIAAGGTNAEGLAGEGPAWYYNGLALVGLLVASVLFFNSLFMLSRGIRAYKQKHGGNVFSALVGMMVKHASTFGGFLAHFSMAIILVGLIGSSMYVTEKTAYMGYDQDSDTAKTDFTIQDFTLKYTSNNIQELPNTQDVVYTVNFDVYKNDQYIGAVSPAVQKVSSTQQTKLIAGVISLPYEDLFVVYKGVNYDGDFSLDVRVNPLIGLVWIGFILLMIGVVLAMLGRRGASKPLKEGTQPFASSVPHVEAQGFHGSEDLPVTPKEKAVSQHCGEAKTGMSDEAPTPRAAACSANKENGAGNSEVVPNHK